MEGTYVSLVRDRAVLMEETALRLSEDDAPPSAEAGGAALCSDVCLSDDRRSMNRSADIKCAKDEILSLIFNTNSKSEKKINLDHLLQTSARIMRSSFSATRSTKRLVSTNSHATNNHHKTYGACPRGVWSVSTETYGACPRDRDEDQQPGPPLDRDQGLNHGGGGARLRGEGMELLSGRLLFRLRIEQPVMRALLLTGFKI
ncbi:hypothetical protein EYF80_050147 [Liparis tanakae]|uniref:Uncharacterized protein n=1 Tax=Liparis tanakae TaxID=230148 RepID=A0A4Z2FG17_9TELE|nr:hypothetical protein EYF80_050147 [Liparis tanakae]